MIRVPVSSLLLGTFAASLALTLACGGTEDKPANAGGGSGTGGGGAVGGSTTGGTGGAATGGSGGSPTGGSAGSGMAGSGVMNGGSAGSGTAGTGSPGACTVTATETLATDIQTVFNVEFTTTAASVSKAEIQFGADTTYGYTAPVDLTATNYKTPLLGMKQDTDYHYRVVVTSAGGTCMTEDKVIHTELLANGLPTVTVDTKVPDKVTGGFLVSEWYSGSGTGGNQNAFILDKDGDLVWAFNPKIGDLTRARMSIDGKYMWMAHGNVPSGPGKMARVAMDGSGLVDMSDKFVRLNHDFTILPDANQTMYFIAYGADSAKCDDIVEFDPVTGMNRTVLNIGTAFTNGACHSNAIQYSEEDDTLVFSDLDHDAYVKVNRMTGAVIWVLGANCTSSGKCDTKAMATENDNDFTGDASQWDNQHNLHMLGKDHFLFFNNGDGSGSNVLEVMLDTGAKTATKMWSYAPSPTIANAIMGDVQRMPNGNTIIAYSLQGLIHEVDSTGTLVETLSWGLGSPLGYFIKTPTLYGAPPR